MPPATVPARDCVIDHLFDDADQLLEMLSPRHQRWAPDPRGWIFRGHADATWELRAKANRYPNVFKEYGIPGSANDWSERADRLRELLALFSEGLNRSGIVIPSPPPKLHPYEGPAHTTNAEPNREAFPLMALAQHHGLPTQLLDWTRRGWVAAYFAAAEAADPSRRANATHLAVWALHRAGFYTRDVLAEYTYDIFYEAPGGTNPNLRAQDGLFTIHHHERESASEDKPSLEQYLATWRRRVPVPVPERLTLPVTQAPRLLRLLAYEGITGASLFPGSDGVVRSMRERSLWESA